MKLNKGFIQTFVKSSVKFSKWKKQFLIFLTGVILLLFIFYAYQNAEQLHKLLDLPLGSLFLLLGLVMASILARGLTNSIFYRNLNISLSFHDGIRLAVVHSLANLLPFSAGLFAKGLYLKQRHRLTYRQYFPANVALYVFFVAINGIVGLAGLFYMTVVVGEEFKVSLLIGFSVMASCLVILWLPLDLRFAPDRWKKSLVQVKIGWESLGQNRILVSQIAGLQVFNMLLVAGRFYVVFHAVSLEVQFVHCVLFSSATVLTRLVTIAPGGIGIREGIVASVSAIFGFDFGVSALIVGIDRLMAVLVIFIVSIICTYTLSRPIVLSEKTAVREKHHKLL